MVHVKIVNGFILFFKLMFYFTQMINDYFQLQLKIKLLMSKTSQQHLFEPCYNVNNCVASLRF